MKQVLFIFGSIIILIAFLLLRVPIEITTQPLHLIVTLIMTLLILILFYFLFRQSFRIRHLGLKIITSILVGLLFLVYSLFGFDEINLRTFLSDYSIPVDIAKYENDEGDVIIERFQRISGSVHYSDWRKVIYDFENGIRISQNFSFDDFVGDWIYYDYEKNEVYSLTISMENGMQHRKMEPIPLESSE